MQIKKQQLEWDMEQWFQIGKGVHQGCILSPCLFKLYAKFIMPNAGLKEPQMETRFLGEISTASDMMAENEEGLKSLLRRAKEESEKIGLKLNIQKTNMTSGPIPLW